MGLRVMIRLLRAQRKNGAYRLRARLSRDRLRPAARIFPQHPVEHGLIDVAYPSTPDLGGEPPVVHPSVLGDRSLLPALLLGQVLIEELRHGIVHGQVSKIGIGRRPGLPQLGDECGELPCGGASGGSHDRSVSAKRLAVPGPRRRRQLPHAGTRLPHRAAALPAPLADLVRSPRRPARGRPSGRSAGDREMLDPDAGWLVGARQAPATGRHWPVDQFPRHAVGRHLEAAVLQQPARAPLGVDRSRPVVVLAGAAHRLLEALLE